MKRFVEIELLVHFTPHRAPLSTPLSDPQLMSLLCDRRLLRVLLEVSAASYPTQPHPPPREPLAQERRLRLRYLTGGGVRLVNGTAIVSVPPVVPFPR